MLEQLSLKAIKLAQAPGVTTGPNPQQGPAGPLGTGGIPNSLSRAPFEIIFGQVIIWTLGIAGSLAVLILVIGGVLYITAAGDQTRIELAKKTIKGAIIGIIIILLSAVIVFALGALFS